MFYCNDCKHEFSEPKVIETTYEEYYGVSDKFIDNHKMSLEKCPHCGSDNIEEMKECDRCGEFFREDDLTDTEGLVGGGIGDLCFDCMRDCEVYL